MFTILGNVKCFINKSYCGRKYGAVFDHFNTRTSNVALTLRLLMSYIYIYMEHLFLMFLDHTQRRSTFGRTPLDE